MIERMVLSGVLYLCSILGVLLPIEASSTPQENNIVIDGKAARVWASSELVSKSEPGKYSISKAFDRDITTAWAEGSQFGGEGESVVIEFDTPQRVSELIIVNGYHKSAKTFSENNRIDALDIMFDDEPIMLFSMLPIDKNATVQINRVVKRLTLNIRTIKKGAKYSDLCVSELVIHLAPDSVAVNDKCKRGRSPAGVEWSMCIDAGNKIVVSHSDGRIVSLASLMKAAELKHIERASDIRLEQLDDFDKEKLYVFRVTMQYDEARESYLIFVDKSGAPLLSVLVEARQDGDGDLVEYTYGVRDADGDGVSDVVLAGKCSGECRGFEPLVTFLYKDGMFKKRLAIK